jgi:DNA-binding PadR family transcriptional regulator
MAEDYRLTVALSRYIVTPRDTRRKRKMHGRRYGPRPDWWMMRRAFFEAMREGGGARRGDVRHAILAMLREQPRHGYELMRELEQRTRGHWRPSAGSIYPTLQQLEDEGLIKGEEQDGRRVYTLTDAGRKEAPEDLWHRREPFFSDVEADHDMDLRRVAMQLIAAAAQVRRVGSAPAQAEAREVLLDSRRRLYELLAQDEAGESAASADQGSTRKSDA